MMTVNSVSRPIYSYFVAIFIMFAMMGCSKYARVTETRYDDIRVEVLYDRMWEASVPIIFRVWDNRQMAFDSASIDYMGIECFERGRAAREKMYEIVDMSSYILIITSVRGERRAVGFYSRELRDGYPMAGGVNRAQRLGSVANMMEQLIKDDDSEVLTYLYTKVLDDIRR